MIVFRITVGLIFFSFLFNKEHTNVAQKKNIDKSKILFNNNENTDEYINMFIDSFNKLKIHYVDSLNESEVIKKGIKGMMSAWDPYTKLLEGSTKESYDILRKGKYGGVGIQMGLRRDTLTVLAPMEDSPAYSEGIHSGDQILWVDSLNINASMGHAISLFNLNEYEDAIIGFNNALKIDSYNHKALYYLGLSYLAIQSYTNAIKNFTQSLLLDPNNSNIYFNLGKAYFESGKIIQAREAFTKVLTIDENYGPAYYYLGSINENIMEI